MAWDSASAESGAGLAAKGASRPEDDSVGADARDGGGQPARRCLAASWCEAGVTRIPLNGTGANGYAGGEGRNETAGITMVEIEHTAWLSEGAEMPSPTAEARSTPVLRSPACSTSRRGEAHQHGLGT